MQLLKYDLKELGMLPLGQQSLIDIKNILSQNENLKINYQIDAKKLPEKVDPDELMGCNLFQDYDK